MGDMGAERHIMKPFCAARIVVCSKQGYVDEGKMRARPNRLFFD
jgi:hypothetical protein